MKKELKALIYSILWAIAMLVIFIICLTVGAGFFSIIPFGIMAFFVYVAIKAWRKYTGKDI